MRAPEGTAIEGHPRWPSPLCDNSALALTKLQACKLLDFAGGRFGLRDRRSSRSVCKSDFGARRSRLTLDAPTGAPIYTEGR